jgi:hypothetical protein
MQTEGLKFYRGIISGDEQPFLALVLAKRMGLERMSSKCMFLHFKSNAHCPVYLLHVLRAVTGNFLIKARAFVD